MFSILVKKKFSSSLVEWHISLIFHTGLQLIRISAAPACFLFGVEASDKVCWWHPCSGDLPKQHSRIARWKNPWSSGPCGVTSKWCFYSKSALGYAPEWCVHSRLHSEFQREDQVPCDFLVQFGWSWRKRTHCLPYWFVPRRCREARWRSSDLCHYSRRMDYCRWGPVGGRTGKQPTNLNSPCSFGCQV